MKLVVVTFQYCAADSSLGAGLIWHVVREELMGMWGRKRVHSRRAGYALNGRRIGITVSFPTS
jgi:hypothetical protein